VLHAYTLLMFTQDDVLGISIRYSSADDNGFCEPIITDRRTYRGKYTVDDFSRFSKRSIARFSYISHLIAIRFLFFQKFSLVFSDFRP